MYSKRFRGTKLVVLLSAATGLLICLLAVQSDALPGQSSSNPKKSDPVAKSTPAAQQNAAADAASTDPADADSSSDDDGPSPGNFLGATFVPSVNDPVSGNGPQLAAAPPPPKPVPADAGGDKARQQINDETANLLALAYALKAEVDRTNQDQLSISVVRKAVQLEQMARKMRDEIRPVLSKN